MYATAREPARADRIERHAGDGFRRTWVRRTPGEVAGAGDRLAADVAAMTVPDVDLSPNPSDANCPPCPYRFPCVAMSAGRDAEAALRSGFRERPADTGQEGRLGGGAWGMGRGAAPPRFRGGR